MNERWLKGKTDDLLRRWRKNGAPLWWVKIHGGPMQRAGVHDYLLCMNGKFGTIELKSPEETLQFSMHQQQEARWVESAGGLVVLANQLTEIEGYLATGLGKDFSS